MLLLAPVKVEWPGYAGTSGELGPDPVSKRQRGPVCLVSLQLWQVDGLIAGAVGP